MAADGELVLGINSDPAVAGAEKFNQAIGRAQQGARRLNDELERVPRRAGEGGAAFDRAGGSLGKFNSNMLGTTSAASRLLAGLGLVKESSVSAARGLVDLGSSAAALVTPMGLVSLAVTGVVIGIASLVQSQKDAGKQNEEHSKSLENLSKRLEEAGENVDALAASFESIRTFDVATGPLEQRLQAAEKLSASLIKTLDDVVTAGRRVQDSKALVFPADDVLRAVGASDQAFRALDTAIKQVEKDGKVFSGTANTIALETGDLQVKNKELVVSYEAFLSRIRELVQANKTYVVSLRAQLTAQEDATAADFLKNLAREVELRADNAAELERTERLLGRFQKEIGRAPTNDELEQLRDIAVAEQKLEDEREERAKSEKQRADERKKQIDELRAKEQEYLQSQIALARAAREAGEQAERERDASSKRLQTFDDEITTAERRIEAMGLEDAAAEKLAFRYNLLDAAKRAGLAGDEAAIEVVDRLVAAHDRAVDALTERERKEQELKEAQEESRAAAVAYGLAIGDALETAVFEGGRARDILRGLLEDVARITFRRFVTSQIITGLGGGRGGGEQMGGFLQMGGVLPRSRAGEFLPPPSQRGRIVDEFSILRGHTVAEGGRTTPELVAPLERDRSGRLGVVVSDVGAPSYVVNISGVQTRAQAQAIRPTIRQEFARLDAVRRSQQSVGGRR